MCFFCQYSPICTTMQMSRQRLRTAAIMMKRLRPSLVARTSTCRSELQNLSRLHRQGHTIEPILNTLRLVMFDTEMIISRKSCFSHTSVHHVPMDAVWFPGLPKSCKSHTKATDRLHNFLFILC